MSHLSARGWPRLRAKTASMRARSRASARSGRGTGLATAAASAIAGPTAGAMSTMLTAATIARATGCAGAATGSTAPARSAVAAASTAGSEGSTTGSGTEGAEAGSGGLYRPSDLSIMPSIMLLYGNPGRKGPSSGLERSPLKEAECELLDPELEDDDDVAGLPGMEAEDCRGGGSELAVRRRCDDRPAPSSSTSLVRLLPDEVEPKSRGPETEGDGDGAGASPETDTEGRREGCPGLTLRRRCDDRSAPSSSASLVRLRPDEVEPKTRGPETEGGCDGAGSSPETGTEERRAGRRGLALQMSSSEAARLISCSPPDGEAARIGEALGDDRGVSSSERL